MILNIRGASGSGKSTLARYVMDYARGEGIALPLMTAGRKKPVGYAVGNLRVLGHYEIANGGMDTVDLPLAYGYIRQWADQGHDVLFEGKTLRDRVRWVRELADRHSVVVVHLTTEIDECIRRIRQRRGPTGRLHDIAPRSVVSMARKCQRDADMLRRAGVTCYSMTLEDARRAALEVLSLTPEGD